MLQDVAQHAPREACGLIASQQGESVRIYPITNTYHSRVRFEMDPAEQLKAFQEIDQNGWQLAAIYHSHPQGPDHPSPTDIAQTFYPDVLQIICYQLDGIWHFKGYLVREGCYYPASSTEEEDTITSKNTGSVTLTPGLCYRICPPEINQEQNC